MPANSGKGSSDVRAGGAFVELFTKDALLVKGLAKAKAMVQSFGSWSAKAGNAMAASLLGFTGGMQQAAAWTAKAGLSLSNSLLKFAGGQGAAVFESLNKLMTRGAVAGVAGGTAAITGLGTALSSAIDHATEITLLSDKLGVGTDKMSAFAYAAGTLGVNFEDLTGHFENFAERVGEGANGAGEAAEAFRDLGIDARQMILKDPIDQLIMLSEAMQKATNETQRLKILSKFGGDQFQWLNTLMKLGPDGIADRMRQAGAVGATLDPARARELVDAGRQVNMVWAAVKSTFRTLGAALLPSRDQIHDVTAMIVEHASWLRAWIDRNKELIQITFVAAGSVVALSAAFLAVGPILSALMIPAQLFTAVLASGLAAVPAAVGVAGTAVSVLGGLITSTMSLVVGAVSAMTMAAAAAVGAVVSIVSGAVGLISTIVASGPIGLIVLAVGGVLAAVAAAFAGFAAQVTASSFVTGGGLKAISRAANSTWGAVRSVGAAFRTTGAAAAAFAADVWDAVAGSFDGFRAAGVKAFGDVLGTALTSWAAIVEAIKGGDLEGAAAIAFTGLKLAWAQIRAAIEPEMDALFGRLSDAWYKAVDTVKDVWADVVREVKNAMEDVMDVFKRIIDAASVALKLMGGLAATAAIKMAEEGWKKVSEGGPASETGKGQARIEQRRNAEAERLAAERAARDKARQDARDQAAFGKLGKLWLGVGDAVREWQAALDASRQKLLEAGAGKLAILGGAGAAALPEDVQKKINGFGGIGSLTTSTKGMFDVANPQQTLGLGSASGFGLIAAQGEKVAANTAATRDAVERLAVAVKDMNKFA